MGEFELENSTEALSNHKRECKNVGTTIEISHLTFYAKYAAIMDLLVLNLFLVSAND